MLRLRPQGGEKTAPHRRRAPSPPQHHEPVPQPVPAPDKRRFEGADPDQQRQPVAKIRLRAGRLRRQAHQHLHGQPRRRQIPQAHPLGRSGQGAGRHPRRPRRRPRHQDQRRRAAQLQRRRDRATDPLVRRRGLRHDPDRDHAAGRHRRRPGGTIPTPVRGPRTAGADLHLHRPRLQDRRPGALCRGQGNRAHAWLHHPVDPQFLRGLQPGAADLHWHALYVLGPG